MNNQFPKDLVTAIQNSKIIPVVGAGVSMSLVDDEGNKIFPSWKELLNHAADELANNRNEDLADVVSALVKIGQFKDAASVSSG